MQDPLHNGSRNRAGMWRIEGCLCRLRRNIIYASPITQQNSLGTWLECDEWNVDCVGSDIMWVIQLSFAQQTWPWDCLDLLQRFKSELGPSIMHDFTILNYPPFRGDGQMTIFFPKFVYENREHISYPLCFCPFWGGYCSFYSFWRDIDSSCHP